MGGGEPRDRHAIRRATHVVNAEPMAEHDRRRIAAMLTADPELEIPPGRSPPLDGHAHQAPHAFLIQCDKGIGIQNIVGRCAHLQSTGTATHRLLIQVPGEAARAAIPAVHIEVGKLGRVVTGKSEGRLRQVVSAERKEIRLFGDLIGRHGGTRKLDHRADQVTEFRPAPPHRVDRHFRDELFLSFHFGRQADQRHHDLGNNLDAFFHDFAGCFHDRLHLHPRNLRHRDAESAAA